MRKIIFANWKLKPAAVGEAVALARATDKENLVICPPFTFIEEVAGVLKRSKLGAQDFQDEGKLISLGVKYIIIGHSDRRLGLGETNEMVAEKFVATIAGSLVPILCVGETLEQKRSGQKEIIIGEEIRSAFSRFQPLTANSQPPIFIAYEPIWAISTSETAQPDKPENTLEVIDFIKRILNEFNKNILDKLVFIYGGSITSANAGEFLKHREIAGLLIGAASLIPEEINQITSTAAGL